MHAGGLNRRFERRRAGRKRTLTGAILKHIKKWLNGSPQTYGFEPGSWQINMVQEMLRERFGISYRMRMLKRMLGRLGFSYSKPRPIPDKSTSKAEQEKFKEQYGHLEKSDPKTYKSEWEKARERSERSAHVSIKRWLTGVIDHKTRVIIHHIITDKRPARQAIYKLLKVAVNVAGIPKVLITDKYKAYSPAVKRLERTLYGKGNVKHITIRAKNVSKLHIRGGPVVNGTRANNNIIEATWSRIKRSINTAYMEHDTASNIIHYHVIHHNFIKPHFFHPTVGVERHETNFVS